MTDAVLFDKWRRERDAEAFRELASRYSAMVYATCLRVLCNPQDAEEAAQECFERLAQAPRLDAPYAGPWLHKVATNRALDRLRVAGRRQIREDRYARERDSSLAPEWDDIYPLVDEAIAGLPEELRVPLVRHFLENETHDTIARDLGVSRTTITYRLQKALERVRRTLKRRGVDVASTALAALLGEKMAESAPVPAALEAAIGRLAVVGLKVAPVAAGISAIISGMAAKVLLGMAVVLLMACAAWQMLAPSIPPPAPPRMSEAIQRSAPSSAASKTNEAGHTTKSPAKIAQASGQTPSSSGMVSGRVYNVKTGAGIAGVEIAAGPDGCKPSAKVLSGSDGVYSLTGLPAGRVYVQTAGQVSGFVNRYAAPSAEVTVDPQTPVDGIDFALEPGIPVSGRVVSIDGKPVAGAHVGAITDGKSGAEHTLSRDDGSFTVEMPNTGTGLQVQAKADGFQSEALLLERLEQDGAKNLELVLNEPLTASIEGRLLLSDGSPAAEYSLHVLTGTTLFLVGLPDGKAGLDGSFKIEKLPAGTYTASYGKPGDGGWSPTDELGELTLETGQTLKNIEFTIPQTKRGLSIAGRVVDKTGKGVAEVTLTGYIAPDSASGSGGVAVTDELGNFRLFGLEQGRCSIQVDCQDREHSSTSVPDVKAGTQGLTIVLSGRGRIDGTVVNAADGKPVPRFEIYLMRGDQSAFPDLLGNKRDITDPNGKFVCEEVDSGPNTLTVKAQGFAQSLHLVQVQEGPTATPVAVRLEPATPLAGRVTDDKGTPLAGVEIYAVTVPSWGARREPLTRSAADGTFSMEPLPPSVKQVVACRSDYPRAVADLNQIGSIVLRQGGEIEGRATLDGRPLEGCRITGLIGPQGQDYVLTKPDGSFNLGPLAAGTLLLEATIKETRSITREVTIEPGAVTEVEFNLVSEDASIEGVASEARTPVANAEIMLRLETPAGFENKTTQTDSDGRYRFENVSAGSALLMYRGSAERPQMTMWQTLVDLGSGETVHQDFAIDGPGAVVGTVPGITSGTLGRVILSKPGAQGSANASAEKPLAGALTAIAACGPDGTFEIRGVPPGDYLLRALLSETANHDDPPVASEAISVHVGNGPMKVDLRQR